MKTAVKISSVVFRIGPPQSRQLCKASFSFTKRLPLAPISIYTRNLERKFDQQLYRPYSHDKEGDSQQENKTSQSWNIKSGSSFTVAVGAAAIATAVSLASALIYSYRKHAINAESGNQTFEEYVKHYAINLIKWDKQSISGETLTDAQETSSNHISNSAGQRRENLQEYTRDEVI